MDNNLKKLELRITELENKLKEQENLANAPGVSAAVCSVCRTCSVCQVCSVCSVCSICQVCSVCNVCFVCNNECICGPCNIQTPATPVSKGFEDLGK